MRLLTCGAVLALPVLIAAFEYPDFVPLDKRQAPGTPKFACHEDCGGVITLSKEDGFCKNKEFTQSFSDCLDCAIEYDIWKYYEDGVTRAAEACNIDATPKQPPSSSPSAEPTDSSPPAPESTSGQSSSGSENPTATLSSSMTVPSEETSPTPSHGTATHTSWHGTLPSSGLPSSNSTVISPTSSSTPPTPEFSGTASHVVAFGGSFVAVLLSGFALL